MQLSSNIAFLDCICHGPLSPIIHICRSSSSVGTLHKSCTHESGHCYLSTEPGRCGGSLVSMGHCFPIYRARKWGPGLDTHLEALDCKQAELKFKTVVGMIVNTCSFPDSSLERISNSITHPQELQNPLQSPEKHRRRGSIFSAREMPEQPHKLLVKDHWAHAHATKL